MQLVLLAKTDDVFLGRGYNIDVLNGVGHLLANTLEA